MKSLLAAFASLLVSSLAAVHGPAKPKDGAAATLLKVELLRDTFGNDIDFFPKDMPVPFGNKVRIAYVCHGEHDLAKAHVLYRVLTKNEPGKKPVTKESWVRLPLAAVVADDKAGPFNPKTGVFAKTKFDQQVPFFAIPASDPDKKQVRTLGGGRVFLNTNGLIDAMGKRLPIKPGDRIEYCVEVTELERKPGAKAATAQSPIRVISIVTQQEFLEWLQRANDEDNRRRELERKQKGLFKEKLP
jgi:hypothetical protein